jgi:CHAT domain-containing protein
LEIHRIVWDPAHEADLRRSIEAEARPRRAEEETIWLDYSLEGDRIKLMAYLTGEQDKTVKHVEELPYREDEVKRLVEQVDQCLNEVDRRGRAKKEVIGQLRETGRRLHALLLPEGIKALSGKVPKQLVLQLDDRLINIPWELLHDGDEFLCLKYSMGRLVSTSQEVLAPMRPIDKGAVNMLVIADPRGDLSASGTEGKAIKDELNKKSERISVELRSKETTREFLQTNLPDYDLFHYAGHSDYVGEDPSQSGLLLADGKLESERLLDLARQKPLPSLVFTNACQSGRTESWRSGEHLFGLANAFLVAGVRHYIGSAIDIFDRSSAAFAQAFYDQLMQKQPIGEALRQARLKTISRYGEETLTWATYVLYGDPSFQYFRLPESMAVPLARGMESRLRRTVLSRPFLAVLAVLVIAGLLTYRWWTGSQQGIQTAERGFNLIHVGRVAEAEALFQSFKGEGAIYHQGMTAVYLNRGHLQQAEEAFLVAQQNQPDDPYLKVAQGHLALGKGKLEEAEMAYKQAMRLETMASWQIAECHLGLGRVFLSRGAFYESVEELDQALALEPSLIQAYTAKGLAMERMGKLRGAMAQYEKGNEINSNDPISALLYQRTREQVASLEETERRAHVDALVEDLIKAYREGPRPVEREDEWSSIPLNMFFLDLESRGQPSPVEGEDAFISEYLARDVTASGRVHRVERALLDRLLEELKLSSSELADPETALRLGKILSAHILATGTILRYRGQLQVNLRAIDTETTRVVATATGTCELGDDPGGSLGSLAQEFSGGISSAYPIRGRVTEVRDGEVVLNVGSSVGVVPGMRIQVREEDVRGIELEVKEVQERSCTAVYAEEAGPPKTGWRVEEVRT